MERIKRDVRITTIYEGTSEIMEMTIARDRWQEHLKTRGEYYHGQARKMEALHASQPAVGADLAALALDALAGLMERARVQRLTRNQHVLFRLGEMAAYAESAAAFARRAAAAAAGTRHEKSPERFGADALATLSRVFGREAAMKVAAEGMRWIAGTGVDAQEMAAFQQALRLDAIHRAQAGVLDDMDRVADVLYDRTQA